MINTVLQDPSNDSQGEVRIGRDKDGAGALDSPKSTGLDIRLPLSHQHSHNLLLPLALMTDHRMVAPFPQMTKTFAPGPKNWILALKH